MAEDETNLADELNATPAPAAEAKKRKTCFFITPIGPHASDIRRATDGIYRQVLVPVCEKKGYDCRVAHGLTEPGSVMDQVVRRLLNDDLVIANLTMSNPNVTYELAVRHAAKKPVICLLERGKPLPFDLQPERVIEYVNDIEGVGELSLALSDAIDAVEAPGYQMDNPVVRAAKDFKIERSTTSVAEGDAILQKLSSLERSIRVLSNRTPAQSAYDAAVPLDHGSPYAMNTRVSGPPAALQAFGQRLLSVPEVQTVELGVTQPDPLNPGAATAAIQVIVQGFTNEIIAVRMLRGLARSFGVQLENIGFGQ